MYMRNNNNNNCLYFMLGATMTALGCMGYCMCKEKGYLHKLKCNHGNGRGMHKMMGKRHLGHKCHHNHHGHEEHEKYEGYQMPEEFTNEMNSSQQNLHNHNSKNHNSKNPENEQQKEQQVTEE